MYSWALPEVNVGARSHHAPLGQPGGLMLTENDVVEAVAAHLPSLGYIVEATCTTTQRGIDIVARHGRTGRRLRVEAKGGTSSKDHTDRYGKCFSPGQVVSHVSRALYKAAVLL